MKKIFSILAAVLFVSSLSAKTIYCNANQAWWTADNDKGVAGGVACYAWTDGGTENNAAWPGVRMEAVAGEKNVWSIDLDAKYVQCIFVRVNATGDPVADWGAKTKDQTIPTDDKDLFTISNTTAVWGDPGCDGEWSKFVPSEPDPNPAKYYITGDSALVTDAGAPGKAWNPDAIKSEKDTFVLNLKADQDYLIKVAVNGTWVGANNVKGYNELTDKANLQDVGTDHNIGFKLKAAGEVKVVYIAAKDENPEVFKVLGNFVEVAPIDEGAKFFITGDSALVTDAGAPGKAWNPSAIKSETDTFVLNLKADQDYILKVAVNGTWDGANNVKGYNELTDKANLKDVGDDHNIGFKLKAAGEVKVVYIAAKDENPEVFKVLGNFVEVEPAKLADGYYLIGQKGWDVAALSADLLFSENPGQAGEYLLSVTLTEGENIKVAEVKNDAIVKWYIEDYDGAYHIDAAHAGAKTIYFRPVANTEWEALEGHLYVPANATAIDNTAVEAKAVKTFENGQLYIMYNGTKYNVQGTIVR